MDYTIILSDIDTSGRQRVGADNDEWTIGTSSSISSGSLSPIDEAQSLWEGETLASGGESDNEFKDIRV